MTGWEKFNLAWALVMTALGIFDVVTGQKTGAVIMIVGLGTCLTVRILDWRKS